MALRAKALRPGDKVGVISPAGPIKREDLDRGVNWLKGRGYDVVLGEHVCDRAGYLAGADEDRLADLNRMLRDPSLAGVFCSRGGYGTPRLLQQIDYDAIMEHPKVFLGYSDITALHIAIHQRTGLYTFHGPMVASDFGKDSFAGYNEHHLLCALENSDPIGEIKNPADGPEVITIHPGRCTAPIIGGNLSLIAGTIGTPFAVQTRGRLLLLEEVGETPYRIDRMLTQLRLAGVFDQVAGIVFGESVNCEPSTAGSPTILDLLFQCFEDMEIPVLYGLCLGHGRYKATVPEGVMATLDTTRQSLTIEESALC